MLDIGRSLLRLVRMNRFRSLQYICTYLKSREHLLDKAAMFIAKTYIVCKVCCTSTTVVLPVPQAAVLYLRAIVYQSCVSRRWGRRDGS